MLWRMCVHVCMYIYIYIYIYMRLSKVEDEYIYYLKMFCNCNLFAYIKPIFAWLVMWLELVKLIAFLWLVLMLSR